MNFKISVAKNSLLSSEELTLLDRLVKFLKKPTSKTASSPERQKELTVVKKIITQWPSANRFPGEMKWLKFFFFFNSRILNFL